MVKKIDRKRGYQGRRPKRMSNCYIDGWNFIFCCSRRTPNRNQAPSHEEHTDDVILDKQLIGENESFLVIYM